MKDATGELSMTAVAVVAIAAIGVVFANLIWPTIRQNILRSTYCSQAFNCTCGTSDLCSCYYCDSSGDSTDVNCDKPQPIQCPNNNNTEKGQ